MGRLTGDNLNYIYGHLLNYHKLARKDRIWFQFKNGQEGLTGHNIIRSVYSDFYRDSGDVGNYTDFNIRFTSADAANYVLSDITDSLTAFATTHPETVIGTQAGTSSGTTSVSPTTTDAVVGKKTDWTTYIVIGAAAAVILLLLWDKKK